MMKKIMKTFTFYALVLMFVSGITDAFCNENASNPLAVAGHTDFYRVIHRYKNFVITPQKKLSFRLVNQNQG